MKPFITEAWIAGVSCWVRAVTVSSSPRSANRDGEALAPSRIKKGSQRSLSYCLFEGVGVGATAQTRREYIHTGSVGSILSWRRSAAMAPTPTLCRIPSVPSRYTGKPAGFIQYPSKLWVASGWPQLLFDKMDSEPSPGRRIQRHFGHKTRDPVKPWRQGALLNYPKEYRFSRLENSSRAAMPDSSAFLHHSCRAFRDRCWVLWALGEQISCSFCFIW